jgi:hypothetical protein
MPEPRPKQLAPGTKESEMDLSQLLRALGLQQAYQSYQENIGQPFANIAGPFGRGLLGLDRPEYGEEQAYRTGQAVGNMPAVSAPVGAVKALAQIPGLLEAASVAPGVFIGPRARNWNKAAADAFEKLEKSGVSNKDAYLQTGTFRSPDGKLRQEISDLSAEYKPGAEFARQTEQYNKQLDEAFAASYLRHTMDRFGIGVADAKENFRQMFGKEVPPTAGSLAKAMSAKEASDLYKRLEAMPAPSRSAMQSLVGNVYQHPELYQAYPDLAQTQFNIRHPKDMGLGTQGYYDGGVSFRDDVGYGMQTGKSLMGHELQHAIQSKEGFALGGNQEQFAHGPMFSKKAQDLNADLSKELTGSYSLLPEEIIKIIGSQSLAIEPKQLQPIIQKYGFGSIDDALAFLKSEDMKRTPFGQYQRLAGEAEARAVQARMNYPIEELQKMFPLESYDVPVDQLIVRGLLNQ